MLTQEGAFSVLYKFNIISFYLLEFVFVGNIKKVASLMIFVRIVFYSIKVYIQYSWMISNADYKHAHILNNILKYFLHIL